jgi:hypothetical protein
MLYEGSYIAIQIPGALVSEAAWNASVVLSAHGSIQ